MRVQDADSASLEDQENVKPLIKRPVRNQPHDDGQPGVLTSNNHATPGTAIPEYLRSVSASKGRMGQIKIEEESACSLGMAPQSPVGVGLRARALHKVGQGLVNSSHF